MNLRQDEEAHKGKKDVEKNRQKTYLCTCEDFLEKAMCLLYLLLGIGVSFAVTTTTRLIYANRHQRSYSHCGWNLCAPRSVSFRSCEQETRRKRAVAAKIWSHDEGPWPDPYCVWAWTTLWIVQMTVSTW